MICLAAFIIFSLLGIFSLAYRNLAKEAFVCILRRLSFRPCESRFDLKVKTQVTTSLMKHSEKLGEFFWKYFEVFSWIFVILFIVSTIYSVQGIYNLIRYKSCDPKNPQNCFILSPTGPSPTACPFENEKFQNLK